MNGLMIRCILAKHGKLITGERWRSLIAEDWDWLLVKGEYGESAVVEGGGWLLVVDGELVVVEGWGWSWSIVADGGSVVVGWWIIHHLRCWLFFCCTYPWLKLRSIFSNHIINLGGYLYKVISNNGTRRWHNNILAVINDVNNWVTFGCEYILASAVVMSCTSSS